MPLGGVAGGDGKLGCLCGKAGASRVCNGSGHSSGCVVNAMAALLLLLLQWEVLFFFLQCLPLCSVCLALCVWYAHAHSDSLFHFLFVTSSFPV